MALAYHFPTIKLLLTEHVNCHKLKQTKKQNKNSLTENIVCMLLTSNPIISCAILDQMSTWNFSKTTN